MATLRKIKELRGSSHLLGRISSALIKAAEDVRNEGTGVTDHAARFVWATSVLLIIDGPEIQAKRAIGLVLQDTAIADGGQMAEELSGRDGGSLLRAIRSLIDF